ncbi:6788_t:CDS:1 [Ambispora gerdemannii]|uniref:6788_t:CDS:1 n=1 Tax=Ambispora gerdemannii TaxID=144530 RepID=A0A9N9B856_9GLOM|nr:6788_t:CDS:1 [Ambispora gerdemannii]
MEVKIFKTNYANTKGEDNKLPNYEKAVKEFFSDIERVTMYNNRQFAIKKFLATTELNEDELLEHLTKHQPCPQNQVILGALYLERGKRHNCVQELKKASESNNPHAQYLLGYCYGEGIGTSQDKETAVHLYQQAVNQRIPAAYYCLGFHYANGSGVKIDKLKTFNLFRKAVERGHLRALFSLAYTHLYGIGTSCDMHKTIYWLKKSSENEARDNVAYNYLTSIFA